MDTIQQTSKTLVDLLLGRADSMPDKTAFVFLEEGEREGGKFKYSELDIRAKSIAAVLQTHNLKNERALLIYESGLDYLDSFFGCLYSGVISVPLHPPGKNKSLSRIAAIAKDSGAKVILSTKEISAELREDFSKDEVLKNLEWIKTEQIENSKSSDWKNPDVTPGTLAYLQYTSGSTGIPKGVMVNHLNLLTNLDIIDKSHPHDEKSVMVTWLPIHHDMGLIYGILLPFFCGYPCYFMTPQAFVQKPYRWLKAISDYKGTHNAAPNFAFELCVNKISPEQKKTLDLSSWTAAMNAAEPVRAETMERFVKYFKECGFEMKHFCPGYGLAEGTLILSTTFTGNLPVMKRFDDDLLERNNYAVIAGPEDSFSKVHVGHSNSIEDTRIAIVNPVTLIECKEGEVGEVWASGKSIAQGYWMREDATAETFRAHISDTGEGPFLRTGDLGFIRDNELYITGRYKDLIIIRGQNHYPQDIEYTVEASHPALRLGCVAAFSLDVEGEEHLGIVQEVQKNSLEDFDADEVFKAIRKAVSEEHDLQVYAITLIKPQSVPKTSSGKIQRNACRTGMVVGTLDVVAEWKQGQVSDFRKKKEARTKKSFAVSKSNLVNWISGRLAEMMQIKTEMININEPFAVYGMDSLKAVELSGDLETLLEKELPATLVYDYPNINSLANFLMKDLHEQSVTEKESETASGSIADNEPIAIIGIGLKFPGADDVNQFWNNLKSGKDSIGKIPEGRWSNDFLNEDTVTLGGFIEDYDKFDPVFFGISPRESVQIDPQQRIAMEVAWQALEDAGINPESLQGKNAGVFMGVCTYDYSRFSSGKKELFDVYTGTGTSLSIVANRLSYFFDFRGPSIAVDTACSSSLVAINLACQSIRSGQSSIAIAGGVNLLLAPDWNVVFTEADMLAPDGHCKTFDADADGYVRSEGCGIIVLKKLSDAERDGDRIYALIKGSALNQDGRSNGITAPNGPSQVAVIKDALRNSNVNPGEVSYLETHGTGTPLGDPIEVNSLKEALAENRPEENTLWIGSVKTNIGHLEAAAGIAGVIKTSLALFHKEIPKHLNYKNLNKEIQIEGTCIKVADKNIQWDYSKRIAGISSFGFGGTNAHLILQNYPEKIKESLKTKPFNIFTLSAKNKDVLVKYAEKFQGFMENLNHVNFEDICYSANIRYPHSHRLAIICKDNDSLKKEIGNYLNGDFSANIFSGEVKTGSVPKIAFLFPGQGAQYIGMGKELYDTHPMFRKIINSCDEILREYLEKPLLEVLFYEKDENINPINQTTYTQPALFSIEYALAKLWMSWGIQPDIMMGHSAGEYVAACLANVFSLEDGLKLVTERGRLMETMTSDGEMYTVFANEEYVKNAIKGFEDTVSIASINSPVKTVISGNKNSIAKILPEFDSAQTEYKKINVSIASHSSLMNSMIDEYRKVCGTVKYSKPEIPVVSNINGEIVTDMMISNPDYWCRHILSPVRFSDGIKACVNFGCDHFIDLGPKPTSIGMAQETVMSPDISWLASFRKNFTAWETILQGVGMLYAKGSAPNWKSMDSYFKHEIISVPAYPFQKQRYWIDEVKGSRPKAFSGASSKDKISGLTGEKIFTASKNEIIFNTVISLSDQKFLKDHIVFNNAVLPGTAYIEMVLSAFLNIAGTKNIRIEDLKFHKPVILKEDENVNLQIVFNKQGKNKYEFSVNYLNESGDEAFWVLNSSGKVSEITEGITGMHDIKKLKSEISTEKEIGEFYFSADKTGVEYGGSFRSLKELFVNNDSAMGLISSDARENKFFIYPALLDCAFQTALGLLMKSNDTGAFIPAGIGEFRIYRKCPEVFYSLVKLKSEKTANDFYEADIELLDYTGIVFCEIKSLKLVKVSREQFASEKENVENWFYKIQWQQTENLLSGNLFPSVNEIENAIKDSFDYLRKEKNLKKYKSETDELDNICISFILKAFENIGIEVNEGSSFSKSKINIAGHHRKLFNRLIEILEADGIVKENNDEITFTKISEIDDDDIHKYVKKVKFAKAEAELLYACGTELAGVLEGKINPLDLIFPGGDFAKTTELYQNSPGFIAMNTAVKEAVRSCIQDMNGSRKLRIIELGAGTGSTTSYLLPELAGKNCEYVFTDISPAFFINAKEKFKEYLFVTYKVLDIEKDPEAQGFAENNFDIIIASNVIHATKDLTSVMDNIKKLFNSEGLLILNEVTKKQSWIDLTFGMTEGWWRFEEKDLRPSYPLLSGKKWIELLKNCGFENVKVSSPENKKGKSFTGQSVILSKFSEIKTADKNHKIFFTDDKTAKAISGLLKDNFTIITEDKKFEKLSDIHYNISFDNVSEIKLLLQEEISRKTGMDISIVIYFAGEDEINSGHTGRKAISDCMKVVNVVKAISECNAEKTPSLIIATNQSQAIMDEDSVNGLADSSLWGLAKVISLEHPELNCRITDIGSTDDFSKLINEVNSGSDETQTAYRSGKRFAARLVRMRNDNERDIFIDKKGAYLITGGAGGLGLATSKWLAQNGAGILFLTGRKESYPELNHVIKEFESFGTKVKILKADVTIKKDLEKVFKEIGKSGFELKGIIHSAGVLDDGVILNQTHEKYENVMSPKVTGALNLHELSLKHKPDFFVMYSSVASMLGSAGQSNHSAANAFLDSLAHYRHSKGLPAISINWGVWSEIGSAAEKGTDKFEKISGIGVIKPEQGIRALEALMRLDIPQAGVVPIDWEKYNSVNKQKYTSLLSGKDFEHGKQKHEISSEEKELKSGDIISQIKTASPEKQTELLTGYIRKLLSGIMGLDAEEIETEIPLNMMGLDSLMAIELKNKMKMQTGIDLNLVKYMEETNIIQLAEELREKIPALSGKNDDGREIADEQIPEKDETHALLEKLENLSEEELDKLLNQSK